MVERTAVNRDVVGSSPTQGVRTASYAVLIYVRLHGQAVKTPPFHGGNRGSNPLGVIEVDLLINILICRHGSIGRAADL